MARRWSGVLVLCGLLASGRVAFADVKGPTDDEWFGVLIRLGALLLVAVVAAIAILVVIVKSGIRSHRARKASANQPVFPTASVVNRD